MPVRYPVEPTLREFIYDALYHFPEEKRFDLKGVYYQIGRSKYWSRRFCDTASQEQILHIAGLLGIKWFLVMYDDKKKERHIRNLFAKYKDEKKNTLLSDIVKRKIYVTTDKKFIHTLSVISGSINSNLYRQNLELSKAGFHARKWAKKLEFPIITKTKEDIVATDYLVRTMLNAVLITRRSKLNEHDILILLYLYSFRDSFVDIENINNYFWWLLGQVKIRRGIFRLMKNSFIERSVNKSKKEYQITSHGIIEINKTVESLLKSNVS